MSSRNLAFVAAILLVLKGCRVYGSSIAAAEAVSSGLMQSATSIAATGTSVGGCPSGSQFVIPAIIKPVLQPEPAIAAVADYNGLGGFGFPPALPPVILDNGGSNNWNHLLYLLIALRGFGGGCGGCGGCGGYGGYGGCGGYGYGGGCGGYGRYGYGGGCGGCGGYNNGGCGCGYNSYGCGGGCGNYGYNNGCGCDSCGYDDGSSGSCGSSPNEINLIIRTDSSSSSASCSK